MNFVNLVFVPLDFVVGFGYNIHTPPLGLENIHKIIDHAGYLKAQAKSEYLKRQRREEREWRRRKPVKMSFRESLNFLKSL